MRVVIFGTGQFYKTRKQCFDEDTIVAFLDNNDSFSNKKEENIPVLLPDRVLSLEFDVVCLMAGADFAEQMREQLVEVGVPEDRIYNFREFFAYKQQKSFYILDKDMYKNEIAVFVPSLTNTGGFRAALYAIEVLQKHCSGVTVISPCKGDGFDEIKNMGVDIVVTSDVSEYNARLWNLIKDVKAIFLNALYYSYLIPYVKTLNKKVIWWIHSGNSFYNTYPLPSENFNTYPIKVLGVSSIVKEAYLRHNVNGYINILPFGVPDQRTMNYDTETEKDKIIFTVIGNVIKIKGIDLVINALQSMSSTERQMLEVWIIGAEVNQQYSHMLHNIADDIPEIKWFGKREHTEVIELFKEIDVLISASREDMLPIVITEAMMNEKACIVADSVGTAGFIKDGINGLIFRNEDIDELKARMLWCVDNRDKLTEIGKQARLLYETEFSMPVFEERLMEALNG